MIVTLLRFSDDGESTLGILFIDGKFFCYTIEDTYRSTKVYGQTCIPSGTYKMSKLRYITPKTAKYRKRFPWFEWHIQLEDVPNFTGIYLHIGNDAQDTRGCILVGNRQDANTFNKGFIHKSTATFKKLYHLVYNHLDNCSIEILDIADVYKTFKDERDGREVHYF